MHAESRNRLVGGVAFLVVLAACSSKEPIKLEMTRETVVRPPAIQSVSFEPGGRLDTRTREYDVTIVLRGDAGLEATCDLAGTYTVPGERTGRPMTEEEPGRYVATIRVPRGAEGEILATGHLRHGSSGAQADVGPVGPLTLFQSAAPVAAKPAEPATPTTCTPAMAAAFDGELRSIVVRFPFDSYQVQDADKAMLRSKLAVLSSNELCKLHLFGFTDEIGSDQYNLALSQNRALAVKWFLESLGIPKDRLETHGMGKSHPVAEGGGDPQAPSNARNRRVEFSALYPYRAAP